MGCVFSILRSATALVLGVVVFVGFLFLLLTNFSDKLLNADFYNEIIAGEDTYNRIYDEILLDEDLEGTRNGLLGEVQVVSDQEMVSLLRQIIPPKYLQSQVEGAIGRTVDYFSEDAETLDLYIDLKPPLDNVKPALFSYIDRRIDALREEELGRLECTPQRVIEFAGRFRSDLEELSTGQVPKAIPSLKSFDPLCRFALFELTFDLVVAQSGLDERAKQGLRERRQEIERQFVAGEAKQMLKVAARPLAYPLIDDAIEQIRNELDGQDRLNLIHRIAVWNDDLTETQIRQDAGDVRIWVSRARNFGKPIALAMLIAGASLLGLVHFPSLKGALRWPGLTLMLTGLVFLVIGKVLESQVPDRLRELVEEGSGGTGGVPASVNALGGDLLASFGKQLTGGIDGPALAVLIIGAVLFGASFCVFLLRPRFPGVR
jgi:hypothetical protein